MDIEVFADRYEETRALMNAAYEEEAEYEIQETAEAYLSECFRFPYTEDDIRTARRMAEQQVFGA